MSTDAADQAVEEVDQPSAMDEALVELAVKLADNLGVDKQVTLFGSNDSPSEWDSAVQTIVSEILKGDKNDKAIKEEIGRKLEASLKIHHVKCSTAQPKEGGKYITYGTKKLLVDNLFTPAFAQIVEIARRVQDGPPAAATDNAEGGFVLNPRQIVCIENKVASGAVHKLFADRGALERAHTLLPDESEDDESQGT